MPHSFTATANPYPRWLTKLGFLLFSFGFLYLLWEWFTIGVMADQEKIEAYMFGSAAMLGEGGDNYASAEIYAASALHGALWSFLLAAVFALAVRKGTWPYRLAAGGAVVLVKILTLLFD